MFQQCRRTWSVRYILDFVRRREVALRPSLSLPEWLHAGLLERSNNSQTLSWFWVSNPQKFCRSFRGQGILKQIVVVNYPADRTSTIKRNQSVNAQNQVLSAHMVSIFVDAPDLKAEFLEEFFSTAK